MHGLAMSSRPSLVGRSAGQDVWPHRAVNLVWSANAWEDYLHWQATDHDTLARINDLIKASMRTPFAGIGKVEPLRGHLEGWSSRRIAAEHRLVYRARGVGDDQVLEIAQCRWHYDT